MTDKSSDWALSAALDTARSNLKPGLWSEEEICQGCLELWVVLGLTEHQVWNTEIV